MRPLLVAFAIAAAGCGDTAVVLSIASAPATEIDAFCVDLSADGASRYGERWSVAELAKQGRAAPWTLTVFPGARAAARADVVGYLAGQEVAAASGAVAFQARRVERSGVTLDRCGAAPGTLAFEATSAASSPAPSAAALVRGPAGPIAVVGGAGFSLFGTPSLAPRPVPPVGGAVTAFVAVDLDGDCDQDLVAVVDGVPVALVRDESGVYGADRMALPALAGVRGVAVGDVDGDGLPDLVACGGAAAPVLRNGGQGRFAALPDAFPAGDALADATACVLADFSGDGHLDLVVGQGSAAPAVDRMYFNDGTGHFTYVAAALPPLAERTSALAAADVDGNGTVDLVAAHLAAPVRLYRNGSGVKQGELSDFSFGLPDQVAGDVPSLLLADLDGDCAPDLVIPRAGAAPRLWRNLNDGGGRFEEVAGAGIGASEARAAAALDIDGDRVLDLLLVGGPDGVALYRQKGAR